MDDRLRLMCVLAHPDDESLGTGGILAKYAAEGVETHLVTATRGERGWTGDPAAFPGLTALGEIREAELRAAAAQLGLSSLAFLDYIDGDLDQADPHEAITAIVAHLRWRRPQVVVSFGPDGAYGHPDHIAICQLTTAAIMCAADPTFRDRSGAAPHRVDKLYSMTVDSSLAAAYTAAFGELRMTIDGVTRGDVTWPDWMITTRVDAADYWQTVWRAIACHRSQLPNYDHLATLPESAHRTLWGDQCFYRAFSTVNGGRTLERDLFTGLRERVAGGSSGDPSAVLEQTR